VPLIKNICKAYFKSKKKLWLWFDVLIFQHNFPHGLVSFADRLSTDPLRHKADYLKNLIQEQVSAFVDSSKGDNMFIN